MFGLKTKLKYFKWSDFECKCGCGLNKFDIKFAKRLDKARGLAGTPFVPTSACRCKEHNEKEGGNKNSSHLKCIAIDLQVFTSQQRYKILKALFNVGFKRIGISAKRSFIHIDIDENKQQEVLWVY